MFLSATTILAHLTTLGFKEEDSTKKVYRLTHPSLSHYVHIKKPSTSTVNILAIPIQYETILEKAKTIPVFGGVIGKSSNYKGYTPSGGSSNPALTFDFKEEKQLTQFIELMFPLQSPKQHLNPQNSTLPINTECTVITKARVGQDKFRTALMTYWNNSCSVTGCDNQSLLVASHIIPWCEDIHSRLDLFNGLLLTPNLDAAFDKGYISFRNDGSIIFSSKISEIDCKYLGFNTSMKLKKIEDKHKEYLDWHRAHHQLQ
ncbi:HNH endonuclease [Acinetobacter faecalis]|uniref:HNH endonuclease n=1 Tax=Acinetobacter faecalis TaxID=2665161 RepID=UPI002A91E476|nr:HNH endonuclease [Acinetobacter faecalis]MDY6482162.1 HNH endonuclease [Acinetobacter faecalis]